MFHVIFALYGVNVPGNESSRKRKYPGAKIPGSENSRERKFLWAKVPGSESTWERKFQLPPRLSLSYSTHAVHGAASLQPVTGNGSTRFYAAASDVASVHRTYHPSKRSNGSTSTTVNHNPQHLLHCLLPPPSAASQSYDLRQRAHNRSCWTSRGHELYVANDI